MEVNGLERIKHTNVFNYTDDQLAEKKLALHNLSIIYPDVNKYYAELVYDTIYIDFDDTVTKKGKVNPEVMMFLYNAKWHNKEIKLITKHENDLDETLESLSIHKGLFNEIIHIRMNDAKYKYIKNAKTSIVIDNAFQERVGVKKHLDMPVFDVDAINALINWKS
jgi:hypothetical protein